MNTIISAARLKPNGLHLGHYLGNFSTRMNSNIDVNIPYFFVIEDLFPSSLYKKQKLDADSLALIKDVLPLSILHNYDVKIVFLSDIIKYNSVINSILYEYININHLRGIHPKRNYLRNSFDNIELSEFMFIVFEVFYILSLNARFVFMNDDNITYVNYARKVAKRINNSIGEVFVLPYLETGIFPRLKGTDGERMSKSRNNEISLSDSPDTVKVKLDKLFASHKAMKYVRIDTNGYYRHPCHSISNEFIPFQYLDTFSNCNSTETKDAFNQGKINISDLKNILLIDILKFIASVEKVRKGEMYTENSINSKLEESLFFAMDIIKSNENKILNIIQ